ncbi:carbohydrate ABC transporter permease, partial [Pelagibacteraceae bacterium]|nr:carbohydrate ABC transporter permease [Pelagibacteraceae bacterium]
YLINVTLIILVSFPIYWAFVSSIKPPNELITSTPTFFPINPTFESYERIWNLKPTSSMGNVRSAFTNSAIVSIGTVVLSSIVSTLAAYALTILRTPFRYFIFLLIIMPILIPGISLLIPLYKLVKELGLMNSYLGLILIHSTGMLTLGVFLMRNAFMSIPTSLREVALLEGSSELRIMFTVMLPLAIPGLLTLMVFALYGSWNDFILAFLFVNTIDMEMLNVFLMKLTFAGSQFDTFWGLLNAGAIISFVPIIIFYIFLQQYFVRGVTGSAVKE